MSKYENQVTDLKNQVANAKNILIILPSQLNVDRLGAGLGLMLGLKALQKEVVVVSEGQPLVAHSNLFGIGDVKNSFSISGGENGDLTLVLENVVAADGTVPSLEKLDWYPEGSNLNLVFHVIPGQKFEPSNIVTKKSGSEGNFDLMFVIGTSSLNELGGIYSQNSSTLNNLYSINIDTNGQNTNFGKLNLVDTNASSVSEMVMQIMPDIGLYVDNDIASNLVAGIYEATQNMTTNLKPDTFMVVGQAMQKGARIPAPEPPTDVIQPPQQPVAIQPTLSAQPSISTGPIPSTQPFPAFQTQVVQTTEPQYSQPSSFNLNQPFVQPVAPVQGYQNEAEPQPISVQPITQPVDSNSTQPLNNLPPFMQPTSPSLPVFQPQNDANLAQNASLPSSEERPMGEFASSPSPEIPSNPAPDWLTPKIYKSGSN